MLQDIESGSYREDFGNPSHPNDDSASERGLGGEVRDECSQQLSHLASEKAPPPCWGHQYLPKFVQLL